MLINEYSIRCTGAFILNVYAGLQRLNATYAICARSVHRMLEKTGQKLAQLSSRLHELITHADCEPISAARTRLQTAEAATGCPCVDTLTTVSGGTGLLADGQAGTHAGMQACAMQAGRHAGRVTPLLQARRVHALTKLTQRHDTASKTQQRHEFDPTPDMNGGAGV